MTPSPASKPGKAYQQGKEAAINGRAEKENPYITRRVIHLSNWWLKGFIEAKTI